MKLEFPADIKDPSKGLIWKDILDFKDEDFDAIDDYYELKNKK